MRNQSAALAQFHVRANNAIGPNLAGGWNFRLVINYGAEVNWHERGASLFGVRAVARTGASLSAVNQLAADDGFGNFLAVHGCDALHACRH